MDADPSAVVGKACFAKPVYGILAAGKFQATPLWSSSRNEEKEKPI